MGGPRSFHLLVEEFYDIHAELEGTCESYEMLVTDLELIIEDLKEDLERIRGHLDKVESAVENYCFRIPKDIQDDTSQELPWE